MDLSELKQIRTIKKEEYGNFDENMNLIGRSWSALLGLPEAIPGWMVSLMYANAKTIRARHRYKEDTYVDALNYMYQAKEMQMAEHLTKNLKEMEVPDGDDY